MRRRLFVSTFALALTALPMAAQEAEEKPEKQEQETIAVDAGDDFVAGDRVILEANFSRDPLGAFPRIFRLKGGNMEVASVNGKRYLRATSTGAFSIPLPEVLPHRFTLEFDLAGSGGQFQDILFSNDGDPFYVTIRPIDEGGIAGPDGYRVVSGHGISLEEGVPVQVRVMADGSYVKVYVNGKRIANAPNARIGRSKEVQFRLNAFTDAHALLGNLRLAAGGKDLYRALNEEGHVTAEGILFDTASDRIRPESEKVLTEISALLVAHPDLKLGIEGHTDNSGADDANQLLSEKRAAAVKNWLVMKGKISAGRLESKGYGDTLPAASNETAEGKQTNRRVELVKL
jgi:OOP family OmpA-OmpF porin